jgi:hemoglobin
MNIEEKPPFDTPFAWIGGEAVVRAWSTAFMT